MLVPSCPSQDRPVFGGWLFACLASVSFGFQSTKICCKTFASGCNNGQICLLEVLETQLDMSAVPLKDPILVSILRLIILEAEIFGWGNYHQTVVCRWPDLYKPACLTIKLFWICFELYLSNFATHHTWQFQLQLGASTSPSDGASLRETYSESSSRPIFPFMQFPFANRSFHPQKIRYCVFFSSWQFLSQVGSSSCPPAHQTVHQVNMQVVDF